MRGLRVVIVLVAALNVLMLAVLVTAAALTDPLWWLALIVVVGALCGMSLAWDMTKDPRRQRRRRTDTPRRGR